MTKSGNTETGQSQSDDAKASANAKSDNKTAKDKGAAKASAADQKKQDKPRKSRAAVLLALLALLIALAAAAGVAVTWYYGEMQVATVSERMATVERGLESNVQDVVLPKVQKLASAQQTLQKSASKRQQDLQTLRAELNQSRLQLSSLSEKVEGGRRRWQLQEIEGLMLSANERLQLYKDVSGAKQALSLASDRLRALNDPRLFEVREQIVNEIAALNALPKPDIESMALTLNSLIQQVPKLPLKASVASDYVHADIEDDPRLQQDPWRHFLDSMRRALSNMVTIRRADSSYEPLMPPDQKFFLVQNLQLKLQSARLLLLQKQSSAFNESMVDAREWVNTFFDPNSAAVAGAMQTIKQMEKTELAWDTPGISGSLEALRKHLQNPAPEKPKEQAEPENTSAAADAAGSE